MSGPTPGQSPTEKQLGQAGNQGLAVEVHLTSMVKPSRIVFVDPVQHPKRTPIARWIMNKIMTSNVIQT